jgi:hypothetical protein
MRMRPSASGTSPALPLPGFAQPREYLPGVELEEAVDLAADLADVDLVEPGVDVGADGAGVNVGVGPART